VKLKFPFNLFFYPVQMDTPDSGEFFIHQHDGQRGIFRLNKNFYIIRYIVINQCEHKFVKPNSLASLSSNCEAIACSIEEHVMVCTSELWRNGAQVWRIEHDAQQSIDHISTSGLLPDDYPAIEREFAEQQKQAGGKKADTDYFFDIPLQTAKSIVGFKHDEAGLEDESFEVFKGNEASPLADPISNQGKRPWWKLW